MFDQLIDNKSKQSTWMHFGRSVYQQNILFSVPLFLILAVFLLAYYVLLSDMYKSVHEKFIEREVNDRLTQLRQDKLDDAENTSDLDDSEINDDQYVDMRIKVENSVTMCDPITQFFVR